MITNTFKNNIIINNTDSINNSLNVFKSEYIEIIKKYISCNETINLQMLKSIVDTINLNQSEWFTLFVCSVKYSSKEVIKYFFDACYKTHKDKTHDHDSQNHQFRELVNQLYVDKILTVHIIIFLINKYKHEHRKESHLQFIYDAIHIQLCKNKEFHIIEALLCHLTNLDVIPLIETKQYGLIIKYMDKLKKDYTCSEHKLHNIMTKVYNNQDWHLMEQLVKLGHHVPYHTFTEICKAKNQGFIDCYNKCGIKHLEKYKYSIHCLCSPIYKSKFFDIITIFGAKCFQTYKCENCKKLFDILDEKYLLYVMRNIKIEFCNLDPVYNYDGYTDYCHRLLYYGIMSLDDRICKNYGYYYKCFHSVHETITNEYTTIDFKTDHKNYSLIKSINLHILSTYNKKIARSILLCIKQLSKIIKQIIPKPIFLILLNRILFPILK